MYINGGTLNVGGDYRIAYISETYSDGSVTYGGSNGILKMITANDKINIGGNFIMMSSYSHYGYLTNGVMTIDGDFYQYNNGTGSNFACSEKHSIVFPGDRTVFCIF